MDPRFSANSRRSLSNRTDFHCYACNKRFVVVRRLTEQQMDDPGPPQCSHCESGAVEKIENPGSFAPAPISFVAKDNNTKHGDPVEHRGPSVRIVRKKVTLPTSSPYVREVLMQLYPHVFRRAAIARIETIRDLFNTLTMFDGSVDGTNGPTDPDYIRKLSIQRFSSAKLTSDRPICPICTDCFNSDDTFIELSCTHLFHSACILPWLELNNSCPSCRAPMPRRHH